MRRAAFSYREGASAWFHAGGNQRNSRLV